MKIVFDTNVLISVFVSRGLCYALFQNAIADHEVIISTAIREELEKKLSGKFKIKDDLIRGYLSLLESLTFVDEIHEISVKSNLRDHNGAHLLQSALNTGAEIIVTGDKDLLVLGSVKKCKIVTPRKLYEIIKEIKAH